MEMLKLSCSTGKSKVKTSQPSRLTEYSSLPRLAQTDVKKKGYERPQPEKIAKLLGLTDSVKDLKKHDVKERMQPERLGALSDKKNTEPNEQKNGGTKSVRRNLNFNETTYSIQKKNKVQNKTDKILVNKPSFKETCRKSMLLPPNSIKDKFLKKCDKPSRSIKKPETAKKSTCINSNFNTQTPATQKKKRIPPNTIQRIEHRTTENEYNSFENLSIDVQSKEPAQHTESISINNMISISREQLMDLEYNVKHLIHETEENLSKLKSTLTCITNILSTNEGVGQLNNCPTDKVMMNKEVQVDICCKSDQVSQEDLTPINIPKCTMNNTKQMSTTNSVESNEDDKESHENVEMDKSNYVVDESFLELENQLNITHAKRSPIILSITKETPVIKKNYERSMKEYMALKSSMSFLQTPDPNRFTSLTKQDNVDQTVLNKSLISRKVFMDLQNLYSDSPDY